MKQRQISFELLRIILICAIAIYHLYLYNGVFYMEYTPNAALGILLSAGTAVPCDYAFIALSTYFLIPKKKTWHPRKFLSFAALVLSLYIIKMITLRGLFGYGNTEYFVDLFLITGAWWYAAQYLLLLLYYPLLNSLIHGNKPWLLFGITGFFGIWFFINGITNEMNFRNDLVMFVFNYLFVGCLYVHGKECAFFQRYKRPLLITLSLVLGFGMIAACLYVKLPENGYSVSFGNAVIRKIIGRYCFPAMVEGLALFELFRSLNLKYSEKIQKTARLTLYVFLLHETVLGVFWYFKLCWNKMAYYETGEFFLWTFIYVISCFFAAFAVYQLYRRFMEPLWNKVIDKFVILYEERISHVRK